MKQDMSQCDHMRLVIVVPSNSTQQQCPLCIVQWEQSEIILLVSSAGRVASVPTSGGWLLVAARHQTVSQLPASSGLGNNDATSLKHLLDGDMCHLCHCHVGTECQGQVLVCVKILQKATCGWAWQGLHEMDSQSELSIQF